MIIVKKGNQSSITDSAISALMAKAGIEAAVLNVKINLGSIKDEDFVKKTFAELEKLQNNADKKTKEILRIVNTKI